MFISSHIESLNISKSSNLKKKRLKDFYNFASIKGSKT